MVSQGPRAKSVPRGRGTPRREAQGQRGRRWPGRVVVAQQLGQGLACSSVG